MGPKLIEVLVNEASDYSKENILHDCSSYQILINSSESFEPNERLLKLTLFSKELKICLIS